MTDNKENNPPEESTPPHTDEPKTQNQPSKEEQERLQKRIEELRKRDPFIYR